MEPDLHHCDDTCHMRRDNKSEADDYTGNTTTDYSQVAFTQNGRRCWYQEQFYDG